AGLFQAPPQLRIQGGGGHEGVAPRIVNDLGVHVLQTAINRQTGALRRPLNLTAQAHMAPLAPLNARQPGHVPIPPASLLALAAALAADLTGLPGLAAHVLALVPDTLAQIRLNRAHAADPRRDF